ncbi:MAG: hypothetical protein HQL82_01505 [Magnetococcales bacterium]|nr:hypothetical protein [Magnetococcales bacterium]
MNASDLRQRLAGLVLELVEDLTDPAELEGLALLTDEYIDSFDTLVLINRLEQEFGLTLDHQPDLFKALDTLDGMEALIRQRLGNS